MGLGSSASTHGPASAQEQPPPSAPTLEPAAAAQPPVQQAAEAAVPVGHLHVHARLGAADRAAFGLHVWGPAAAEGTQWDTPLPPSGEDWYGLRFDVPLAASPPVSSSGNGPALGLLLHRGEDKRACLEIKEVSEVPSGGKSIWFGHGSGFASAEPSPTAVPAGDLSIQGARAHWLSSRHIAWRAAAGAPAGSRFLLHASAAAALEDGGTAGVLRGDAAGPQELARAGGLAPRLAELHPYLRGCELLSVPASVDPRKLCRYQLAVSMQAQSGEMVDCTGVQVGPLLDELFAYDGPLGCSPLDTDPAAGGVSLALWAPTALSVSAVFYDDARGPAAECVPMVRREGAEDDGVWRLAAPAACWGRYYTYRVQAYHPAAGRVALMETPDPYSRACAADSARSLAVHLPALLQAVPGGDLAAWRAAPRPALGHRAAAAVYELHIRDFSASDPSVPPELRGKYLAFELEGTHGDRHLRRLAEAGVTHVQLLPSFDFGSVPERAEDRAEQAVPEGEAPDSEAPQAAAADVADVDSFNWGYDPVLYDVPEGSYATEPDGTARVLEHRRMVRALHAKGLRVVLDVVYNHTHASGPEGARSVLDKCVPGYYHRRSEAGAYESSTCMNNTAAERAMMERLVADSVVHWATEYRVDGFRFDLMGHLPLKCIQRCRAALDALTVEEHGVDGPRVLLYGEGWEFGEVAGGQRGVVAVQRELGGSGVGAFNDRVRDAALGGSPFADLRIQGFATGLALRSWPKDSGVDQGTLEVQMHDLLVATDKIRVALAASLKDYHLAEDCEGNTDVAGSKVHGGGVAYTSAPVEALNYVSAHDNETLYDNTVWKMPPSLFTPEERMRANWLCTAVVALSHGVPFFHAGDELLRSKSLDRDSYNSGDWFNVLDFTGQRTAFGTGLPPKSKNGEKWGLMRPLLRDSSLRPTPEMIAASTAKFCELLRVRASTPLIGLTEAADVLEKVDFPGCGSKQLPGVIVMQTRNGPAAGGGPGAPPLCRRLARVVTVLSARLEEARVPAPPGGEGALALRPHPLQAASLDAATRGARLDAEAGELVVPPQSAAVFVEPLPGEEGWGGEP